MDLSLFWTFSGRMPKAIRSGLARRKTTQDMDDARYHLNRLALVLPGEYFVFDQRTRQFVASVDGFDGDRHR